MATGDAAGQRPSGARVRMSGQERRAQLLDVARKLFAERGREEPPIEELASRAGVSKPVVYEHFGSKEGIYEVVKDREVLRLVSQINDALVGEHPRILLEQAAGALLAYIENE